MGTPLTARIIEEHANAFRALPPAGPTAARRRTAIEALTASGLPTSRDENWKYANLRPLERLRFNPAPPAQPLTAADLPAAIPGFARYVFVDGAFAPALSAALHATAAALTPLAAAPDAGGAPAGVPAQTPEARVSADERFALFEAEISVFLGLDPGGNDHGSAAVPHHVVDLAPQRALVDVEVGGKGRERRNDQSRFFHVHHPPATLTRRICSRRPNAARDQLRVRENAPRT